MKNGHGLDWTPSKDLRGVCFSGRPCGLWPVLQQRVLLMSTRDQARGPGVGGHVDVHGSCCCQKPGRSPGSVLPLTVKGKEAILADMDACRCIAEKEDIEGFWDTLPSFDLQQHL